MNSKNFQKSLLLRSIYALVLIGASVLLAVIMVEAGLRLAPGLLPVEVQQIIRRDPSNYGVVHPYIGHLHTPNNALVISGRDFRAVHHTDGYGFRNSWPWPATADIVALGDSVTFGQGVEDDQAWPKILARSFPKSRVINLGLIGAGPQQYLRVYETFGFKLHPKVILVGFFMGNDFWDAEMFDMWLKSGAGGSYMVWRDFGSPMNARLDLKQPIGDLLLSLWWRVKLILKKSYLCNLLLYVRSSFIGWPPSGKKYFNGANGSRLELSPGQFATNTSNAGPGTPVFNSVIKSLARIDSLASENGATAVVVLQPSKEEVYLPLIGESLPDAAAPLRSALSQHGIRYLDLLPEFRRRAAEGEVLFFETDGHPNARGYELIADLVGGYLKEHAKTYGL